MGSGKVGMPCDPCCHGTGDGGGTVSVPTPGCGCGYVPSSITVTHYSGPADPWTTPYLPAVLTYYDPTLPYSFCSGATNGASTGAILFSDINAPFLFTDPDVGTSVECIWAFECIRPGTYVLFLIGLSTMQDCGTGTPAPHALAGGGGFIATSVDCTTFTLRGEGYGGTGAIIQAVPTP